MGLLDYAKTCGDSYTTTFLKPLIEMGAPHSFSIQELFDELDLCPEECEEESLSKHVKHVLGAILAALQNDWYERTFEEDILASENEISDYNEQPFEFSNDFLFQGTYIIFLFTKIWMTDYKSYELFEKIIFELLRCGERVLEKNREGIEKHILKKYKKMGIGEMYNKKIVDDLYKYVEEFEKKS